MTPGTRLGPYEIEAAIGAGGMGEVYKARDTRLGRTVAIKVLPAAVSTNVSLRARFEREAKAIAQLNHPHICTLFDVGDHADSMFLVMEHLVGQTLAERLASGPLPLEQALQIGIQIADALAVAHKQGIVHRDLKPGNVMLTRSSADRPGVPQAKLLDFGLAKLTGHGDVPAATLGASASTRTAPLTGEGTILGTLQYMAPEQVEGKPADARTDLWALGAILYEMITGARAFEGGSAASLIGAILEREPAPLSARQPLSPPGLDRLVRRCLAKDPDERWASAHDVADELRWVASTPTASGEAVTAPRRATRILVPLVIGVAGLLLGAGATWWLARPVSTRLAPTHVTIPVTPAEELNAGSVTDPLSETPGGSLTALTWTPDGRLVFVGRRSGVQQLYVRQLGTAEAVALKGTEGGQVPAVSADGQWIAFWAGGAIRKVPVGGGPVMDLATGIAYPPRGLAWDDGGAVFFGAELGPISKIRPEGGAVQAVTTTGQTEVSHQFPCPLPGGRTLLYTLRKREWSWGDEEIVAHTLSTGASKVLLRDAADARYVQTGHLVFLRRGTLFAVPFDPERLELRGREAPVVDAVAQAMQSESSFNTTGAGQYAVAATGALAWVTGRVVNPTPGELVLVDRRGQVTPLGAPVRGYGGAVRLSPDGRRLAVTIFETTRVGLWIHDIVRGGTPTPLNLDGESEWPLWTPDGRRMVFGWLKDGQHSIAIQPADGTAPATALLPGGALPSSFTKDGQHLAGVVQPANDIVVFNMTGDKPTVESQSETREAEFFPEFSPDGRWLAYASDVSGQEEVWVRPYPGPGAAVRVSLEGGRAPAWHPKGRELFFVKRVSSTGQRLMMAADFTPGAPPGRPHILFTFTQGRPMLGGDPLRSYDVAPDGNHFYALRMADFSASPPVTHINLIQSWFEELKAKVPRQ